MIANYCSDFGDGLLKKGIQQGFGKLLKEVLGHLDQDQAEYDLREALISLEPIEGLCRLFQHHEHAVILFALGAILQQDHRKCF
jgi:hypothetical protein